VHAGRGGVAAESQRGTGDDERQDAQEERNPTHRISRETVGMVGMGRAPDLRKSRKPTVEARIPATEATVAVGGVHLNSAQQARGERPWGERRQSARPVLGSAKRAWGRAGRTAELYPAPA